ncbi:MAG: hypothetical protein QNJ37_16865 [Crocosphaera sp.]|nr:hypothetical protein [Crocosphaera sp.]
MDNTDISLIGGQDEKTSTSTPITVSTQERYISNKKTEVISISQDGGKEISEFIITSTNGVFLRESYNDINFLGNNKPAKKICAIEKGTKIHILKLKRIPNNELWYKIYIIDRGKEYKERKIIYEKNPTKTKTKNGETKTETKAETTSEKENGETKAKTENREDKTETTEDMSIMSPEENCPLPPIITTGWIIGQYDYGDNERKTININVDEKIKNPPDKLIEKQSYWERFQSCLFCIKFYQLFPMSLGIIGGFQLYYYAKSGENSILFWNYLKAKGVLLFCISLSAIIFVDSYGKRLDWYSRYPRPDDEDLSWGLLGQLVHDLLSIFFNIDDFFGNVAAGFMITLLFLKFFPMNKD